ncbi:MAG: class II aldolase/adducin family protein, partial [Clostridia bacterium]|nr:class II aldolase/adducin family protein [Clostridia bacterium]
MIVDELVEFSNYYGRNNDYVLAGGGNTSAKNGNMMYVKSSGTQLATIKAEQFVKI